METTFAMSHCQKKHFVKKSAKKLENTQTRKKREGQTLEMS